MTIREVLGADVNRVYEQVDDLLDREDGLLMFFDGDRMVSYTQGFGVSPSQFELLSVELEQAVRGVVGAQRTTRSKERRSRETQDDGRGRGAGLRQHLGRHDRRNYSSVADGRDQSVRSGRAADGDRSRAARRVLRLASETA
jgi:hypothetical protein